MPLARSFDPMRRASSFEAAKKLLAADTNSEKPRECVVCSCTRPSKVHRSKYLGCTLS